MKKLTFLLALVPMLALGQIKQQSFTTNSGLVVSNYSLAIASNQVTARLAAGITVPSVTVTSTSPGVVYLQDVSGALTLQMGTNDNILLTNVVTGNFSVFTNGQAIVTRSNNAATTTPGIILSNNVAAGSGAPKGSPQIALRGYGYGTTASSNTLVEFTVGAVPTSATTAGGNLIISNSVGGAASVDVFRLSQAGALTAGGTINSGGSFVTVAGGRLLFGNRGSFGSIADGTLICYDSAAAKIGTLQWAVTNTTKTVNYSLVALDVGGYYNNVGAGAAATNTLPTAVAGMQYSFYVDAAQILCIQAVGSDTIRSAGTVSAAAGNIFSSTIGSALHLFSPKANVWVIDHIVGTWTGPQ